MERSLATICVVETPAGASIVSFVGALRYRVATDLSSVVVEEYQVRGTQIDGPDLGPISYRSEEPWHIEVRKDHTFTFAGRAYSMR